MILRFFEGTEQHQYRRVHHSRLGVLNGGVADGSKVSFVDAVDLDIDDPALLRATHASIASVREPSTLMSS